MENNKFQQNQKNENMDDCSKKTSNFYESLALPDSSTGIFLFRVARPPVPELAAAQSADVPGTCSVVVDLKRQLWPCFDL